MSVIAEQRAELARILDPATPVKPRPTPEVRTPPDAAHKLLDAAEPTETTGQFVALVSDWDLDRSNERFARHAFDGAIAKLQAERRALPVLYGHDQRSVTAVIGHVPPEGWAATDTGLIARGWIDTEHEVPRHVYRALKSGALQWSIGFSRPPSRPLPDGGRELLEVDELYELSAVPVPANARTRTLEVKELEDDIDSLREQCEQLRRELEHEGIITPDVLTFASRPERERATATAPRFSERRRGGPASR
jgi:HK97 family phage prohead protease